MASQRKIRVQKERLSRKTKVKLRLSEQRHQKAEEKRVRQRIKKEAIAALGLDKFKSKLKPRYNDNPIENWAQSMLKDVDFLGLEHPLLN
jgi:hypothetical protein